jgi:hypothetical protein
MMKFNRAVLLAVVLGCYAFLFAASQASTQAPAAEDHRKTSDPYTGDLSIFDSPGREERLQINRVMDILGIAPGKPSPISEPDRAGSPCAPRAG